MPAVFRKGGPLKRGLVGKAFSRKIGRLLKERYLVYLGYA